MRPIAPGDDAALDVGLPGIALSVRQPWAWAIVQGGKDVENRAWRTSHPALLFRGRVAIHASSVMTQREYKEASDIIRILAGRCPAPALLERGCVVGSVEIVDAVHSHDSRWFSGPVGLIMRSPWPCPPIPARGALGFFSWHRDNGRVGPLPPVRWMQRPEV